MTKKTITLTVTGIGNVPSFKNTKKIARITDTDPKGRKRTRPILITDPKKKEWMEQAVSQLSSQLNGLFPTAAGETPGEWRKRLQTALWQLSDDSLFHMMPGRQSARQVKKGCEGCVITIEFPD